MRLCLAIFVSIFMLHAQTIYAGAIERSPFRGNAALSAKIVNPITTNNKDGFRINHGYAVAVDTSLLGNLGLLGNYQTFSNLYAGPYIGFISAYSPIRNTSDILISNAMEIGAQISYLYDYSELYFGAGVGSSLNIISGGAYSLDSPQMKYIGIFTGMKLHTIHGFAFDVKGKWDFYGSGSDIIDSDTDTPVARLSSVYSFGIGVSIEF